ncbi:MAG: phosphoribosylamine--glycine ligase [Cyclobacteriaceae bacterium]
MNILLIGSGGREHALAWKIAQSSHCSSLFIAPGNPGTAALGTNIPLKVDDFEGLASACLKEKIDLVVVGPEIPLVKGIRDFFQEHEQLKNLLIVGPGRSGARLEGSKEFSKSFMNRHGIPTAAARTFHAGELPLALSYLDTCSVPIVLKADGLAAGKGVIITSSREEAKTAMTDMLANGLFGDAGTTVLVEQFLTGIELSVFVLTDGKDYVLLPEAKDYKRIGVGDSGPNTGGMGAVSPVPFANASFMEKVKIRIIEPTIRGLHQEKIDYRGFIFFGLINVGGDPYVIEYNARMGDPETQSVMTRLDADLVELLVATAKGEVGTVRASSIPGYSVTISMVSAGYPGDYTKGYEIILQTGERDLVFHAGTAIKSGKLVSDGGRVLSAVGRGADLPSAIQQAYATASGISWDGVYFRTDIGQDLL